MPRLRADDVACWVAKSSRPLDELAPGWAPGEARRLERCLRASYRLTLMEAGQPCLLWVSGRQQPGVHGLGALAAAPTLSDDADGTDGAPVVAVRFTRLAEPLARADLLADPVARDAEVLRMPAGSNPSWLSARQYAAVLAHLGPPDRKLPPPRRLHSGGWDHGSS